MGTGVPDVSGAASLMSDVARLQQMSLNEILKEYENTMLAILFSLLCLLLLAHQIQNQQQDPVDE